MKPKILHTLALLNVFLAYCRIKIGDIGISVDAQFVLSWILSENIKTKYQFVKNRPKESPSNDRETERKEVFVTKI